jgi:hypothetical protein
MMKSTLNPVLIQLHLDALTKAKDQLQAKAPTNTSVQAVVDAAMAERLQFHAEVLAERLLEWLDEQPEPEKWS